LRRLFLAVALAAAGGLANAQPVEIAGVDFEPTVQVGGQELQLNGVGLRTWAFFGVYAAGLYVPQKSNSATVLLAQKGPRRVVLAMLRDVGADAFSGAISDGLEANNTQQELARLAAQIDALRVNLKAIGEVRRGDRIHFEFTPEVGTRIRVNGQQKGGPIEGDEFFTAVLRVWIGENPVDAGLRKGLVGI